MDSGPTALLRCIELLDHGGIAHTGGGCTLSEARKPAIVEPFGARFKLGERAVRVETQGAVAVG